MKALVFGRYGQVGTELDLRGPAQGVAIELIGPEEADFTKPELSAGLIAATDADVVINAAAYTAVDKAETEEPLARAINATTPGAMVAAAAAKGLPFLHISTDYVFDGSPGRPWREDDATGPLGAYGRTKLEGEELVAAAGGAYATLRTAWVFSAHSANFVKTMLRVGAGRGELTVVDDQFGGPTPAGAIADALLTVAKAYGAGKGVDGVFHFAGAPATHWAGFAEAIFAGCGWPAVPTIRHIPSSDYPTPAKRPANSVLDCSRIHDAYGIAQPDWRAHLKDILKALAEAPA